MSRKTTIEEIENGYDICSGNRRNRHDSIKRKLLSRGFNLFNRKMFGIKVNDVNCGLKAFKKGVMNKINLKHTNAPWFIDTETLAKAYRKKMKIKEIDISHYNRKTGKSKISPLSVVTETVYHGILLKTEFLKGG